jgi:hypothetical protein
VSLSASPGYYNAKTLGPSAQTGKLTASVRLVSFNGVQGWPPAAYVGFYQGPNRDQSVQFLVIRNRDSDNYLVAGYRVVQGGKEAKVQSLANLPLEAAARVSMSFKSGEVTLRFNDRAPMRILTSMAEAAPYVSVSSGTAEFNVDP